MRIVLSLDMTIIKENLLKNLFYFTKPTSEIDDNCFANSTSTAPAPGKSRPSLI